MDGDGIIRVVRFRPLRTAFDAMVRDDLLPDLGACPGLVDVHVGRQGPGELGPRIAATIWETAAAMDDALGDDLDSPRFHPEVQALVADRDAVSLPLDFSYRDESNRVPSLLRLATGTVHPGELPAYASAAAAATASLVREGAGPIALYVATREPDEYLTFSVWPDWTSIEHATNGDVARPIAVRMGARLLTWSATHFEAIPNVERRRAALGAGGRPTAGGA